MPVDTINLHIHICLSNVEIDRPPMHKYLMFDTSTIQPDQMIIHDAFWFGHTTSIHAILFHSLMSLFSSCSPINAFPYCMTLHRITDTKSQDIRPISIAFEPISLNIEWHTIPRVIRLPNLVLHN